jgi:hypothetical protein
MQYDILSTEQASQEACQAHTGCAPSPYARDFAVHDIISPWSLGFWLDLGVADKVSRVKAHMRRWGGVITSFRVSTQLLNKQPGRRAGRPPLDSMRLPPPRCAAPHGTRALRQM